MRHRPASRRAVGLGCALWLSIALGCTLNPAPAAPAEDPAPSAPTSPKALRVLERVTAGADPNDALPLLVLLHGLGDRPEGIAGLADALRVPARVVLPAAPLPYRVGTSWYRLEPDDARRKDVTVHAARLAALIQEIAAEKPTSGRAVVTGFSQGGVLSFALALRHADVVAGAFPLSGDNYVEPAGAPPAPIHAFHGTTDRMISFEGADASVQALAARGFDVKMRRFDGVGHSVPPVVLEAWRDAVETALSAQAAAGTEAKHR